MDLDKHVAELALERGVAFQMPRALAAALYDPGFLSLPQLEDLVRAIFGSGTT